MRVQPVVATVLFGRLAAFVMLATLAMLASVGAACRSSSAPPATLAGEPRGRVIVGAAAAQIVGHMHGKDVAPQDTVVVEYGPGPALTLFVSRYARADAARSALDAMVRGMASGRSPFAPPVEAPGERGVYLTRGPGGAHSLWVGGRAVYWLLGADEARVQRGMRELR